MTDVNQWNVTDASNNGTPPAGAPEGMAPSGVNDVMRAIMGGVARLFADTNSTLDSGGSSNAYTLTPNQTFSSYARGDWFVFEANHTNTGAATMNVSAIGAQSIVAPNGSALAAGDITSGGVYIIFYDGTNFQLIGASSDVPTDPSFDSVSISDTTAVDLTDATAPLVVSPGTGQHLELDNNEVQSKADATTAGVLRLNPLGGRVDIGAQSGTGAVNVYHDAEARITTDGTGTVLSGDSANVVEVNRTDNNVNSHIEYSGNSGDSVYAGMGTNGHFAVGTAVDLSAAGNRLLDVTDTGTHIGYAAGDINISTTSDGADFFGTVWDFTAGTTAQNIILLRNTEGGVRFSIDGDTFNIGQTNSSGTFEDFWIAFNNNGGVDLYNNNEIELQTQDSDASGNTTGASIQAHDGSFYDVGMNQMPVTNVTAAQTLTDEFVGHYIRITSGTADIDLTTSSNTPPTGSTWMISNVSGSNNTIDVTGVTLTWQDGAGGQTGDRTLADGGACTIIKVGTNAFEIFGTGLS